MGQNEKLPSIVCLLLAIIRNKVSTLHGFRFPIVHLLVHYLCKQCESVPFRKRRKVSTQIHSIKYCDTLNLWNISITIIINRIITMLLLVIFTDILPRSTRCTVKKTKPTWLNRGLWDLIFTCPEWILKQLLNERFFTVRCRHTRFSGLCHTYHGPLYHGMVHSWPAWRRWSGSLWTCASRDHAFKRSHLCCSLVEKNNHFWIVFLMYNLFINDFLLFAVSQRARRAPTHRWPTNHLSQDHPFPACCCVSFLLFVAFSSCHYYR